MTARDEWTPGTFTIAMSGARDDVVVGETWGAFGIDRRCGWWGTEWTVTHLPTGCEMGAFRRKPAAKRYCRAVAPLTDWDVYREAPLSGALLDGVSAALDRFGGRRGYGPCAHQATTAGATS